MLPSVHPLSHLPLFKKKIKKCQGDIIMMEPRKIADTGIMSKIQTGKTLQARQYLWAEMKILKKCPGLKCPSISLHRCCQTNSIPPAVCFLHMIIITTEILKSGAPISPPSPGPLIKTVNVSTDLKYKLLLLFPQCCSCIFQLAWSITPVYCLVLVITMIILLKR